MRTPLRMSSMACAATLLMGACASESSSVDPTSVNVAIGPTTPSTLVAPLPSIDSAPEATAARPWAVDTTDCDDPDAANTVVGDTVTIGSVAPQTGGLVSAVYAPLVKGFQAYVDHANATRLLGDVHIDLVVADDEGDAAITPSAVSGLIDAGADVISGILGSANNLAVRDQLGAACIPQLMALGNSARFGDVASYPWTMGGLVPVSVETTVYVNSIVRMQGETTTVALLVSDDSDGQTFANSFAAAASDTGLQLLGREVVEPGVIVAPGAQVQAIAAQAPTIIVASLTGPACATFLIELANVRQFFPGWNPDVYMSGGCADASILSLAGDASTGVYTSSNLGVVEPVFDAAMAALGLTDGLAAAAEGWTAAEVTVAILAQAQQSAAGLTRASVIDAARNLAFTPSLTLPGVQFTTNGTDDAYPAESLQVIRYDAATRTFSDVGPLVAQFES